MRIFANRSCSFLLDGDSRLAVAQSRIQKQQSANAWVRKANDCHLCRGGRNPCFCGGNGDAVLCYWVSSSAISFEFREKKNPAPLCKANFFVKSALVFRAVLLCGTAKVLDDKFQHAAKVAAEPKLVAAMKENKHIIMMSEGGFSNLAMIRLATKAKGFGKICMLSKQTPKMAHVMHLKK